MADCRVAMLFHAGSKALLTRWTWDQPSKVTKEEPVYVNRSPDQVQTES